MGIKQSSFRAKDALEMKVTLKKPKSFYVQACLNFLKGVDARPAEDGKEAKEALAPMNALRISGLGEACAIAAEVATQVEAQGAASIVSLSTHYPTIAVGKTC